MGILSGIVSYLFGLVLNLLDACIDGFLGALGFDLDTFESYFPAARDYHDVIIGFAIGLLFIMLIFQIFRNFGIVLEMEAEDPLKMVGKTALFLGMIVYSRSIMNFIIKLLVDPYAIFLGTASAPYEFKLMTIVTSMFNSVFSNPFMSIVALIMFLVLGWQFLKLTVECVERYVVFYFVLYCAPVVFATGAFKSTAQILKSWTRMLASQAILLLLNIWSIKLFTSFMPVFEQDASNLVFNFLLGYAFLKFAQKADTLLRILGLNTASTGDMVRSLGGTVASIALAVKSIGNMAQSAGKAAGNIFGGGSKGGGDGSGGSGGGGDNSEVGGMRNNRGGPGGDGGGGAPGGNTGDIGGVTNPGISASKRAFASEVLNSARSQMPGAFGGGPGGPTMGQPGKPNSGGGSGGQTADGPNEGGADGVQESAEGGANGNIAMEPGKQPDGMKGANPGAGGNADPSQIDMETKEGLDNLAHALPHNKYDPDTKKFSGGGFPEFTGENANIIGSAQMPPAEGVHQSTMKMPDGTTGTVYQNEDTGDAHVVQFGSVDNGVIQGTISSLDPSTGGTGEDFAFKAVHSSVPGAEGFSQNSVPISDGFGGTYHVSSGGNTDIFASPAATGGGSAGASSYTPGQASKMAGPAAPAPSGGAQASPFTGTAGGGISSETGSVAPSDGATPGVRVPGITPGLDIMSSIDGLPRFQEFGQNKPICIPEDCAHHLRS